MQVVTHSSKYWLIARQIKDYHVILIRHPNLKNFDIGWIKKALFEKPGDSRNGRMWKSQERDKANNR